MKGTDRQLRLELNEITLQDPQACRNHHIVCSVYPVVLRLHGDSTRGVDLTSKLHMYPSKLTTTCPHTIEISRYCHLTVARWKKMQIKFATPASWQ